ncbi:hypothetical protein [Streptomyces sp. NPDC007063]|uniref:hypothetical protein n=1 Tax=Streptomyces sp. NPDC007063 TaxID=3364772 RepID=UPI003678ADCE
MSQRSVGSLRYEIHSEAGATETRDHVAHRRMAQLLDELTQAVRREAAQDVRSACRELPEGSDWFSGMFDAASRIEGK